MRFYKRSNVLEEKGKYIMDKLKIEQDIKKFSPRRMGISMAATWSWGAALAVGIAIMHTKGLIPFLVWAIANCLGMAVFGILYTKVPRVREWKNLKPMLFLWIFIGVFAIIMNLSALKEGLGAGTQIVSHTFIPEPFLTPIIMIFGILIVGFIWKTRLKGSILTDVGQFSLQMAGVIAIAVIGIIMGTRADIVMIIEGQGYWMFNAVMGLLFAATASGMQWQRIEAIKGDKNKLQSTLWGSAFFTIFMIFVFIAGLVFDGSLILSIPFLIVVLAITSSTADSGMASLQFVSDKLFKKMKKRDIGTIISLIAVLLFPLAGGYNLTQIWTFYASVRWYIVGALLIGTVIFNIYKSKQGKKWKQKTKY